MLFMLGIPKKDDRFQDAVYIIDLEGCHGMAYQV
jgi:hypothetical protein